MTEAITWTDFDLLERFMTDAFQSIGVPEDDARTCADVLITADKRGVDTHGVGRFKTVYYDRILAGIQQPVTQVEVIKDDRGAAVIDGHHGMGMVVSRGAMKTAIEKANRHGLGMVAVRNSTHYGICGYYTDMATGAGMIGITGTNARPSTAPTFGVENMLGTNPLVFGLPTDEDFPFTLDCATSVAQRGKIEWHNRAGTEIPQGWVIDRQGHYRTDTSQILKDLVSGAAALTPLGGLGELTGGHKGYGYATVVEVLCAALQDGAFLKGLSGFDDHGERQPYALGHFFVAIDISAFIDPDRFRTIAGTIMRQLRASQRAPGQDRIYTAGEKEHLTSLDRAPKGAPINPALAAQLIAVRDEQQLNQYNFPFES